MPRKKRKIASTHGERDLEEAVKESEECILFASLDESTENKSCLKCKDEAEEENESDKEEEIVKYYESVENLLFGLFDEINHNIQKTACQTCKSIPTKKDSFLTVSSPRQLSELDKKIKDFLELATNITDEIKGTKNAIEREITKIKVVKVVKSSVSIVSIASTFTSFHGPSSTFCLSILSLLASVVKYIVTYSSQSFIVEQLQKIKVLINDYTVEVAKIKKELSFTGMEIPKPPPTEHIFPEIFSSLKSDILDKSLKDTLTEFFEVCGETLNIFNFLLNIYHIMEALKPTPTEIYLQELIRVLEEEKRDCLLFFQHYDANSPPTS